MKKLIPLLAIAAFVAGCNQSNSTYNSTDTNNVTEGVYNTTNAEETNSMYGMTNATSEMTNSMSNMEMTNSTNQ